MLHTERSGEVWLHDQESGLKTLAAKLDVYQHDEEGLQSIAIDPNFEENGWVYLYYSPPLDTPVDDPATIDERGRRAVHRHACGLRAVQGLHPALALPVDRRLEIDLDSEQQILQVGVDRGICCHVGGDIVFDGDGNLLLSTGDDTNPFESEGYTPIDEREEPQSGVRRAAVRGQHERPARQGPAHHTSRRTAATRSRGQPLLRRRRPADPRRDLRHGPAQPVPHRVQPGDGELYIADYSPDASSANPLRGPAGQGKWSIVTEAANFGWPYCATAELPYERLQLRDRDLRARRSTARTRSTSRRTTPALTELPPVTQPDVWYTYTLSDGVPGARDRRHRPDGRARVPVRREGHQGQPEAPRRGPSTTTACRCSTSGRATTSRRSSPRAVT